MGGTVLKSQDTDMDLLSSLQPVQNFVLLEPYYLTPLKGRMHYLGFGVRIQDTFQSEFS